jgi:hypothetical protein
MIAVEIDYNDIGYYVTFIKRLKYVSSEYFPIILMLNNKVVVYAITTKLM